MPMQYLLLAILSIIIYAEILPTISLIFEYIRTWLAYGIAIIQQKSLSKQEEIQNTQDRLTSPPANQIGFDIINSKEYYEEEDEDYE